MPRNSFRVAVLATPLPSISVRAETRDMLRAEADRRGTSIREVVESALAADPAFRDFVSGGAS